MLSVKSIISCNLNTTPLYSNNVYKTICEYKNHIKYLYNKDYIIEDDELIINCVQGIHGYRCGLIGYVTNLLCYDLSKINNPIFLQALLNRVLNKKMISNDYEIFSFFISFISSKIPLLNIGLWDIKQNLFYNDTIFKYNVINNSFTSIFNLKSVYMLRPLFDCGSTIYSNKQYTECGFEPWDTNDRGSFKQKIFNKGLVWAFYESNNKKNGIVVINIDMIDDAPQWIYLLQLKQIVRLKEYLQNKFLSNDNNYEKYETYIVGDFKTEFNLHNILPDIKNRLNIFENANIIMCDDDTLNISNNDSNNITNTNFIFYNDLYAINKKNTKEMNNITNDNLSLINLEFENQFEKNICKFKNLYKKQKLRNYINSLKKIKNIDISKENYELKEIVISNIIVKEIIIEDSKKPDIDNKNEGESINPIENEINISYDSDNNEEWQTI